MGECAQKSLFWPRSLHSFFPFTFVLMTERSFALTNEGKGWQRVGGGGGGPTDFSLSLLIWLQTLSSCLYVELSFMRTVIKRGLTVREKKKKKNNRLCSILSLSLSPPPFILVFSQTCPLTCVGQKELSFNWMILLL
jgi:hypothetical protein